METSETKEPISLQESRDKKTTKAHRIKAKKIKDLTEKIKNAKTLMIVSIKNLPSKQFQDIKKSIREHALVQVAKKNIMLRAIKKVGKPSILGLENHIAENCAFVISDIEGFELAGILAQKKTPATAKAGQISPDDIEVKAGLTDLIPGPAISELGALGIQIAVEEGKISIKAPKVIVKKGGKINEATASLLQKLHIQPFSVGLEPVIVYDIEKEKIYADIKVDFEEAAENLRTACGKALGFSQKIAYYTKETIGYLLAKANLGAGVLEKLKPAEPEPILDTNKPISSQKSSNGENISDSKSDTKEPKEEKKNE